MTMVNNMISTKEYWKKMSEGPTEDKIKNITLALSQRREVILKGIAESEEHIKEWSKEMEEYEQKVFEVLHIYVEMILI